MCVGIASGGISGRVDFVGAGAWLSWKANRLENTLVVCTISNEGALEQGGSLTKIQPTTTLHWSLFALHKPRRVHNTLV